MAIPRSVQLRFAIQSGNRLDELPEYAGNQSSAGDVQSGDAEGALIGDCFESPFCYAPANETNLPVRGSRDSIGRLFDLPRRGETTER